MHHSLTATTRIVKLLLNTNTSSFLCFCKLWALWWVIFVFVPVFVCSFVCLCLLFCGSFISSIFFFLLFYHLQHQHYLVNLPMMRKTWSVYNMSWVAVFTIPILSENSKIHDIYSPVTTYNNGFCPFIPPGPLNSRPVKYHLREQLWSQQAWQFCPDMYILVFPHNVDISTECNVSILCHVSRV